MSRRPSSRRLGDSYRTQPALAWEFGPPDPPPGSCEECGGITRHDPDCPNAPKNRKG